MIWKAWFVPPDVHYPEGTLLISSISEDRVERCLKWYPDHILFEAELTTDDPS